ncbi:hypothetical protein MHBO_001727 [Bonamia ostreae]|uniref:Uncharacterized protein n=1 Tax=Bonamia ostreae TaxID=126728 RepID=A0ABV2AKL9_9EUKA
MVMPKFDSLGRDLNETDMPVLRLFFLGQKVVLDDKEYFEAKTGLLEKEFDVIPNTIRIIRNGCCYTMDLNKSRLNFFLNEKGEIFRIRFG